MPEPLLNPALTLCGALALELSASADPVRVLPRDQAGQLAQHVARDLAQLEARASELSMSTVGAHYDPVKLLRPTWPLFAQIDQLSARAPGQEHSRVIAFGAADGQLPGNLSPIDEYPGGPLRVVPFVLRGEAQTVAEVKARLERDLIEHGMADARTALFAQKAFAIKIEHARYLTLHDLCAMTALHYEHAGLGGLWPLIETALLSPAREVLLDAPPEPLMRWRHGCVEVARLTENEWASRYAQGIDPAQKNRLRGYVETRQRQLLAVLGAHALSVREVPYSDW